MIRSPVGGTASTLVEVTTRTDPKEYGPPRVCLTIAGHQPIEMPALEARALAAILIVAAEQLELERW